MPHGKAISHSNHRSGNGEIDTAGIKPANFCVEMAGGEIESVGLIAGIRDQIARFAGTASGRSYTRKQMPLKPSVIFDVPADTPSMKKAIGPKLAKKYAPNPKVAIYAFILKFPDGVVTGRAVSHALSKLPTPRGPTILAGESFTVEAMGVAKADGCDVIAFQEFFWTDASYAAIRQII